MTNETALPSSILSSDWMDKRNYVHFLRPANQQRFPCWPATAIGQTEMQGPPPRLRPLTLAVLFYRVEHNQPVEQRIILLYRINETIF